MRTAQRVNYAERVERAIARLEALVAGGKAPSLADLADAAAMSDYHFHRVFRLMTGEAVGDAITRVRLAGSIPALARGGLSAATGQSGYATGQAYARAMKSTTGSTPTALRSDPHLARRVSGGLAMPRADDAAMRIEVVEAAPLRLLAVRNVGAYEELNAGYGRLFDLVLAQVDPDVLQGIWGIPGHDPRFTPAEECHFTCALDTGTAGKAVGGLEELHIASGVHARLSLTGDYDLLHLHMDALYDQVIEQGLPLAHDLPLIHYHDDAEEVAPHAQRADIYVRLQQEYAA